MAKRYLIKMAESSPQTVEENYGEVEIVAPDGSKTYRARPGQHSTHTHRPDFAGWGKGPPIYLALLDVIGLNPRHDGRIEWTLRGDLAIGDSLAVPNLQIHGGSIGTLTLKRISVSTYEIAVQSNVGFELDLGSLVDTAGVLHPTAQRQARALRIGASPSLQRFTLTLP